MEENNYTYTEWDYDNNVVTKYKRTGECNGCGDCCRSLIEFVAHPNEIPDAYNDYPDIRDGGVYTDEQGVWHQVINENGEKRLFKINKIEEVGTRMPCLALNPETNMCTMHFDKNLLCKGWPFSPKQVTPFKNCSYVFEVEETWDIE